MRILFLIHRTPFPPNKGEKLRSFWELRTLAQRHEVDLFCFYDDPKDENHLEQLSRYCSHYYAERLTWIRSRIGAMTALLRGRPITEGYFYSFRMLRQVQAAIKQRNYDRILVFSSSMARYVESKNDIPKILDLVDVDSEKWRQYAGCCRFQWAWFWRLEARRLAAYEAFLVRHFDATMVCTDSEADLLKSKAHWTGVRVLENHLEVAHYDPAAVEIPDEVRACRPYIVFSGSMDYFPNVDGALYFYQEIFPLVRRVHPDVKFIIAGRNPHSSIRKLSTDPGVKVTGSVVDIRPYLCAAAVAVAPMRIARGVQNKVLEALAAGVPVVTTKTVASGLGQTLSSLVSCADTPQEFAGCVIRAISKQSPTNAAQLRTGLRDYMEGLSLDTQLERLIVSPRSKPPRYQAHQPVSMPRLVKRKVGGVQ
jgi:sugar transferase (PEP-CTERM/EpsH1 system associated)